MIDIQLCKFKRLYVKIRLCLKLQYTCTYGDVR